MSSNIFKEANAQTSMAECNLCVSNILEKDLRIAQLLDSKKVNTFNI
jgi:hypothetical protein